MFLAKPPVDAVAEADLLLDVEELLGTCTALQIGAASSDSSDSSDTSTDSDDETRRPERCDERQVSTRAHHTYSKAAEPVGVDLTVDLTVSTLALHWAAACIASWRMAAVCWTWELSRSWLLCACAGGALAAGLVRAVPRSGVSVRQG